MLCPRSLVKGPTEGILEGTVLKDTILSLGLGFCCWLSVIIVFYDIVFQEFMGGIPRLVYGF